MIASKEVITLTAVVIMVQVLFELGQTLATPGALDALAEINVDPNILYSRHVAGDWGDLCDSDKEANELALEDGGRIFSCYEFGAMKLYVITEADRSATTLMRDEEY